MNGTGGTSTQDFKFDMPTGDKAGAEKAAIPAGLLQNLMLGADQRTYAPMNLIMLEANPRTYAPMNLMMLGANPITWKPKPG